MLSVCDWFPFSHFTFANVLINTPIVISTVAWHDFRGEALRGLQQCSEDVSIQLRVRCQVNGDAEFSLSSEKLSDGFYSDNARIQHGIAVIASRYSIRLPLTQGSHLLPHVHKWAPRKEAHCPKLKTSALLAVGFSVSSTRGLIGGVIYNNISHTVHSWA